MVEIRKVSVVSIVEKGTRFYLTALKSFAYQTYQNSEWLIIDNTGSDVLQKKLQKYLLKDKRLRFICNEQPQPKAVVLKQAFDLASGDYIAFLNPYDLWVKDKLARQIGFMVRYKAPLCHTSYAFADDKYHLLPIGCYHIERDLSLLNYTPKNPVSLSTLMLSKDVLLDFSKFEYSFGNDEMTFFLKSGIISSGMTDVLTLCRPVFDIQTQRKIEELVNSISKENPNAEIITSKVLEHHVHSALNIEGLKLDPSICIGYDVITSLTKLKNFKI